LIVVYFGVLNHERQVDVLVEAIAQAPDIGLLIAGRGDLHDAVVQQAAAYDNIIWLDWIAYEQVPIYTMLGDVVYACLKEVSGNPEYMAPNKLFDAFAAGKAIIATEGIGEMSEILQQYPAGIMLPEVDADSLLTALNSLKNRDTLQQLQANARLGYEEYNWLVAEGRLKELYGQLL
jgi:glycosyltransferase involved in cell wall biosynthesis